MNLKLGSDGDIVIGRGAERVTGQAYVGQLISNRLKTLKGEWELNTTIGLPWFSELLVHNYNLDLIQSWIHRTIESTPQVIRVVEIELGVDSSQRKLIVGFEVESIYGNIQNVVGV